MENFLLSLTYENWLVILALTVLATIVVMWYIGKRRHGVERNGEWTSYKELFIELGVEAKFLDKRNESLTSMHKKLLRELNDYKDTVEKLSNEKAELEDKLHLDNDTRSQILS